MCSPKYKRNTYVRLEGAEKKYNTTHTPQQSHNFVQLVLSASPPRQSYVFDLMHTLYSPAYSMSCKTIVLENSATHTTVASNQQPQITGNKKWWPLTVLTDVQFEDSAFRF
jgi:hypothetical protein